MKKDLSKEEGKVKQCDALFRMSGGRNSWVEGSQERGNATMHWCHFGCTAGICRDARVWRTQTHSEACERWRIKQMASVKEARRSELGR